MSVDHSDHTSAPDWDSRHASRRTLLGAAGGLVLAANGLVRLAGPASAAGPQGSPRAGQSRHGKHRFQPPRLRLPRGSFGPEGELDITFVRHNDCAAGTEPIGATCFFYKWGALNVIGSADKTVAPGEAVAFPTFVKFAALFFDHDRHNVWAKNPFLGYPTVEINSASRGSAGPQNMAEGDTLQWQFAPDKAVVFKIDVKRETDDADHKIFTVRYWTNRPWNPGPD